MDEDDADEVLFVAFFEFVAVEEELEVSLNEDAVLVEFTFLFDVLKNPFLKLLPKDFDCFSSITRFSISFFFFASACSAIIISSNVMFEGIGSIKDSLSL